MAERDVTVLKESLLKEVPAADDASVERCEDILTQLEQIPMNLEILQATLIGAAVNKLKKHERLGPKAKSLIKKWKSAVGETKTAKPPESPVKSERRDSLEDDNYNPESEITGLPPSRFKVAKKILGILDVYKKELKAKGISKKAIPRLLGQITAELEACVSNKFRNDNKGYLDKIRSLCFNLKKNSKLSCDILMGFQPVEELLEMSPEELASEEMQKSRTDTIKNYNDAKRLDWDRVNEDKINDMCGIKGDLLKGSLFTCGRCKSTKTTSTQKQTRSADEPMTVFVLCMNCGKRWKC